MAKAPRPKRRVVSARNAREPAIAFRLTSKARHVIALAREADAEQRAVGNAVQAYQVRQRLDERISSIARRIASKPLASRDDLLTLALAGWYAPSARQALLTAILRAGGVKPKAL